MLLNFLNYIIHELLDPFLAFSFEGVGHDLMDIMIKILKANIDILY